MLTYEIQISRAFRRIGVPEENSVWVPYHYSQRLRHEYFMSRALVQARKALVIDEVPVGAVVINREGKIIARAYNRVEKECSQCAHAELLALAKAGKKLKNWRLEGCWLYVTLQPCIMCMGLIRLSRLDGVVYGATSPLFGSVIDMVIPSQVYKSDVAIVGGILQEEAAVLLRKFFQNKRKEKGEQNKKGARSDQARATRA